MAHKILIVEDDHTLRSAYQTKLTLDGYQVQVAIDGEQALDMLADNQPDLVLLDLILPGISGLEVFDFIKKRYPDAKVVVFSNVNAPEVIQQAVDMGAARFLPKITNTPNEVSQVIKQTLEQDKK